MKTNGKKSVEENYYSHIEIKADNHKEKQLQKDLRTDGKKTAEELKAQEYKRRQSKKKSIEDGILNRGSIAKKENNKEKQLPKNLRAGGEKAVEENYYSHIELNTENREKKQLQKDLKGDRKKPVEELKAQESKRRQSKRKSTDGGILNSGSITPTEKQNDGNRKPPKIFVKLIEVKIISAQLN